MSRQPRRTSRPAPKARPHAPRTPRTGRPDIGVQPAVRRFPPADLADGYSPSFAALSTPCRPSRAPRIVTSATPASRRATLLNPADPNGPRRPPQARRCPRSRRRSSRCHLDRSGASSRATWRPHRRLPPSTPSRSSSIPSRRSCSSRRRSPRTPANIVPALASPAHPRRPRRCRHRQQPGRPRDAPRYPSRAPRPRRVLRSPRRGLRSFSLFLVRLDPRTSRGPYLVGVVPSCRCSLPYVPRAPVSPPVDASPDTPDPASGPRSIPSVYRLESLGPMYARFVLFSLTVDARTRPFPSSLSAVFGEVAAVLVT